MTARRAPRIMMLSYKYHPLFAGAAVAAHNLGKALVAQGISVEVLTRSYPDLSDQETCDGVTIRRLAFPRAAGAAGTLLFDLLVAWHLFRRRKQVDVLHVHSCALTSFVPMAMARLLGVATVLKMTLLGCDDPAAIRRQRYGRLRALAFRCADRVVGMTEVLGRAYRCSGEPPQRLVRINQGIDCRRFQPAADRRRVRERLGLPVVGFFLCTIGAVTPRKGYSVLIDAFREVAAKVADTRLLVVGMREFDGHAGDADHHRRYIQEIDQKIDQYGLRDRVIFTGVVDNVEEYLQASDVFVFPSGSEGFGTALVEAMATGLAPVVSDLSGIAEEVVDRYGIIVRDGRPSSFAAAMLSLLGDTTLRETLGRGARLRAVEAYSFETTLSRYLALYRQLGMGTATGRGTGWRQDDDHEGAGA